VRSLISASVKKEVLRRTDRHREREREKERIGKRERGRRERGGERERRPRYWRTRSPQDVIAEQTEGPRTISINKIYAPRTQSASSSFYRSSSASGLPQSGSPLSSLITLALSRRCLVSTPPSSAFYPMSKWKEKKTEERRRKRRREKREREEEPCDSSSIFPGLWCSRGADSGAATISRAVIGSAGGGACAPTACSRCPH